MLRELALVYDIPLQITIEVGRLRLRVRDLLRLRLGPQSSLKSLRENHSRFAVNEQNVARGEVIIVEQSTGVRIVEVPKPAGIQYDGVPGYRLSCACPGRTAAHITAC